MATRTKLLLAVLMLVPGAVFAEDEDSKEQERDKYVDTWSGFADKHLPRIEEKVEKGVDEVVDTVAREVEEQYTGCNNASLGSRTREAMGCD